MNYKHNSHSGVKNVSVRRDLKLYMSKPVSGMVLKALLRYTRVSLHSRSRDVLLWGLRQAVQGPKGGRLVRNGRVTWGSKRMICACSAEDPTRTRRMRTLHKNPPIRKQIRFYSSHWGCRAEVNCKVPRGLPGHKTSYFQTVIKGLVGTGPHISAYRKMTIRTA